MVGRIIETDQDVAEGAAWLAEREPRFAAALALTGPLPLRRGADGFETLFSAIVSQQVSTAAAAAIWTRLSAIGATTPDGVLASTDEALRAAGLSRQKVAYGRAIAASGLDFAALRALPDAEIVAELTRLKGIGIWTAEIYAMFSLGRADVFAPGDLALQEAAHRLFELDARPGEKALRAMSLAWSPWRSVAARLLWAYYRVGRGREGVR
jgi:DNA-3-methyladenine glycosylase II